MESVRKWLNGRFKPGSSTLSLSAHGQQLRDSTVSVPKSPSGAVEDDLPSSLADRPETSGPGSQELVKKDLSEEEAKAAESKTPEKSPAKTPEKKEEAKSDLKKKDSLKK